jgi:predicted dehydrogenase
MSEKSRVRVGVAGAGYIANLSHLPFLSRHKDIDLDAICDLNQDQARRTAQRFHIPRVYSNLKDMLSKEKLQLVDICLPPELHFQAITETLEHGVNCLVEKPMTLTTKDAEAAIDLADRKRLKLFVIHNYSALPGVLKAKTLVAQGSIGQVRGVNINHLNIFMDRHLTSNHWVHSLAGDYFSEVGPHLAMLLVEFMGPVQDATAICMKASKIDTMKLDECRIIAKSENALGTICCSENCPSRVLTIDIWGTEGWIQVNADYQAAVCRGAIDTSMNVWARGREALKDISTRQLALIATAFRVLGGYPAETGQHRYLIDQCIRDLKGEGKYPIDTNLAKEAVRVLELAFSKLQTQTLTPSISDSQATKNGESAS